MEESKERKDRLRAMRMEAAQADISCNSLTYDGPGSLANPLVETSEAQRVIASPRFDFYTNPTAAFTANNSSTLSHQNSQGSFAAHGNSYYPMVRFPSSTSGPQHPPLMPVGVHNNYSVDARLHQPGYFSRCPGPPMNPVGLTDTHPPHHLAYPGAPYQNRGRPSIGSPQGGRWYSTSPRPDPFGRGRNHFPNSGRSSGRSFGSGMSAGCGPSGGRERDYRDNIQTRDLYNNSMMDDPWKDLQPVIWRGVNGTRHQPLLKTEEPSHKRDRASDARNVSNSKPSLAEYLAASFNEAVKDVKSVS